MARTENQESTAALSSSFSLVFRVLLSGRSRMHFLTCLIIFCRAFLFSRFLTSARLSCSICSWVGMNVKLVGNWTRDCCRGAPCYVGQLKVRMPSVDSLIIPELIAHLIVSNIRQTWPGSSMRH